jgi:hypothetical protein
MSEARAKREGGFLIQKPGNHEEESVLFSFMALWLLN